MPWPKLIKFSYAYKRKTLFCSYGCQVGNKSEFIRSANLTEEKFQENPIINWDAIIWVNRPMELWMVQVILAYISLTEALLLVYLGYKVSSSNPRLYQIKTFPASTPQRGSFECFLWCLHASLVPNPFCSLDKSDFSSYFRSPCFETKKDRIDFFQGNIWQQLLSRHFILEMVNTIPFTITVRSQSKKRQATCRTHPRR